MQVDTCAIPGLLLLTPTVHADARGSFFEVFHRRQWLTATGLAPDFVQENQSRSRRHVLRGLHWQHARPQAKLVRVVRGEVFDVAVDLRPQSPAFGRWVGHTLSEHNHQQVYLPEGLAHGFLVLSESADVVYGTTRHYEPGDEHTIAWNDPTLAIDWPLAGAQPVLSAKDASAQSFTQAAARFAWPSRGGG